MAFDTRSFRHALGSFPTGVAVVTAETGGARMGITVNSFTSVSLDPPMVLWCMDRRSRRYGTFANAAHFTISILESGHQAVSVRLATPGEHSLEGLATVPTEIGPPGLADALAVFECARETVHDGGDHAIVVGRVLRFRFHSEGRPLVFFRGRYGALADLG